MRNQYRISAFVAGMISLVRFVLLVLNTFRLYQDRSWVEVIQRMGEEMTIWDWTSVFVVVPCLYYAFATVQLEILGEKEC